MSITQRILAEKYKIIAETFRRVDRTGGMFEYKGWIYKPWEDREDDNTKIMQAVISPSGEEHFLHWTPYSYMHKDDFQLWVDLGAPLNYIIWDRTSLAAYAKMKADLDAKLNKDNPGVPPTF